MSDVVVWPYRPWCAEHSPELSGLASVRRTPAVCICPFQEFPPHVPVVRRSWWDVEEEYPTESDDVDTYFGHRACADCLATYAWTTVRSSDGVTTLDLRITPGGDPCDRCIVDLGVLAELFPET